MQIYDQIFHHAILSTIILHDQYIDFYKFNSEYQYKDIAYVVCSSGIIYKCIFEKFFNLFPIGSTGIPKFIYVSHECILPNLEQLK